MQLTDRHRLYWTKNLRVTGLLLTIWFLVTFVLAYFARGLTFSFFGWPFSVWFAGQGALIVYTLIVWFYQGYMAGLDRACDVQEDARHE